MTILIWNSIIANKRKNMSRNIAVGIDLGGTHLSSALIDIDNLKIIHNSLTRNSYDHRASADEILNKWTNNIEKTISKSLATEQILGIGVAMPGPFDYKNGISKMQQKMVSLYEKHIPTEINARLDGHDDYAFRFLNDATCFAVGESLLGTAKKIKKVVVLTLGTGFGSAFIENTLPIVERKDVPPEGCLWHLPFKDGIGDNYFSTGWFTKRYNTLSGKQIAGVKELLTQEEAQNYAVEILEEFGSNLGEFIGPWLKKFNAEVLIIGGNISKAVDYFILSLKDSLSTQQVEIQISTSDLMEEAAIIGSAKLFDPSFWQIASKKFPNL